VTCIVRELICALPECRELKGTWQPGKTWMWAGAEFRWSVLDGWIEEVVV
jgi:hypothetical protein